VRGFMDIDTSLLCALSLMGAYYNSSIVWSLRSDGKHYSIINTDQFHRYSCTVTDRTLHDQTTTIRTHQQQCAKQTRVGVHETTHMPSISSLLAHLCRYAHL
jgi:hypothetical protein